MQRNTPNRSSWFFIPWNGNVVSLPVSTTISSQETVNATAFGNRHKGSFQINSVEEDLDWSFLYPSPNRLRKENNNFNKTSIEPEDETSPKRGHWGSRAEFLLSCIGCSVGLGNVWRFPYLAYKNGGAVFLIPYVILLLLVGKPIYFLEVALGQFSSKSSIAVWRCCPIGKGIGMAMQIVCIIGSIYYNVIVGYTVFYTVASFASELPWKDCFSWWGPDENCFVRKPNSLPLCPNKTFEHNINTSLENITCNLFNNTPQTASEQYWNRFVLKFHESEGIEDMGTIKWDLALCLLFSWVVVFLCLCKGIKSSGKVVYFTATFPYVVLLVLLIRGVTLDGASIGLHYLFIPDWSKLADVEVWKAAAEQMFFSLSTSWGALIMFGSYNKFRHQLLNDAIIVSLVDLATSLLGCVAIFSILGYLSQQLNLEIENVATAGLGLAFVVYPEAIALLPISQLWSVLFFFMLFTLGLDSEFALLETVLSNIFDRWPSVLKRKTITTLFACIILFLLGLPCVTYGGQYVLNIMDAFGPAQSVVIVALSEMICLMWIYGVRRLKRDFEFMLETKLSSFWLVSWGFICPVFLFVILIFSIIFYKPLTYGSYNYPDWAIGVGWLVELLSVAQIPIWALIMLYIYWRKGDVLAAFQPTDDWGPADETTRLLWRQATDQTLQSLPDSNKTNAEIVSVTTSRF